MSAGNGTTSSAPPKRVGGPAWVWVVGGVLAFVGAASLIPEDPQARAESDARWRAEQAIDLCWQQQGRKSLAPESQRFIAGACELGEEDYFKKYGRYYTRNGQKP